MIILHSNDIIALYLLLKDKEAEIDVQLASLLRRVEKQLFEKLSIEEIEKLPELYKNNINILDKEL